jgi:hypothetical protein
MLSNFIPVTSLGAGASITVPHGLSYRPTTVMPDRGTPIVVVGTPTSSDITFTNSGTAVESAIFRCRVDHSIQTTGADVMYWRGSPSGTASNPDPGGGGSGLTSTPSTYARLQCGGGGNPAIICSKNVFSAANNGTAGITVTYTVPFGDAGYAPLITVLPGSHANSNIRVLGSLIINADTITIPVRGLDGNNVDSGNDNHGLVLAIFPDPYVAPI